MFEMMLQGVMACLEPINLLAMLLSVPVGIIVGCLPGFGAATGLVLILPMTYTLDPGTAFVALTGVYLGAEYGGSISAILINTPGTAAAVMTGFDGFPLARQGKARDALLVSNIASFSGGLIGGLMMLFFMPLLGNFVLQFGAGEIFLLASVGLLLVGAVTRGNRLKGIISVGLGLFFTFFGAEGVTGFSRFDFGIPILVGGLPILAGLLAMFAIPQMLDLAMGVAQQKEQIAMGKQGVQANLRMFRHYFTKLYREMPLNILRSGIIGVIVGMIPGVGASVASMGAYSAARKASKHPEEFGHGSLEGIAAPESANNALVGGSLIPVLSLGIPGSPAAAIYMGAIFLHGMTPGPNFLIKQADLVYLLIMAVFLCSLVQLLLGALTISAFANILKIPASRLFPSVVAVCCVGAFVIRSQDFDIAFFIYLGIFSYVLCQFGFNMSAIVLGAFLAPTMESSLMEAMNIAPAMGGLITYFMTRTVAMVMLALIVLYVLYLLTSSFIASRRCAPIHQNSDAVECRPGLWSGERGLDLALFSLLFIGAAAFYYLSLDYPSKSRLFPSFTFMGIMVCCTLGIVRCLFFGQSYGGKDVSPLSRIPWKKFSVLSLGLIVYLFLMQYIGFYIATLPYIIGTILILEYWKGQNPSPLSLLKSFIYALIFTAIIYVVFNILLMANMPLGIFIENLIY